MIYQESLSENLLKSRSQLSRKTDFRHKIKDLLTEVEDIINQMRIYFSLSTPGHATQQCDLIFFPFIEYAIVCRQLRIAQLWQLGRFRDIDRKAIDFFLVDFQNAFIHKAFQHSRRSTGTLQEVAFQHFFRRCALHPSREV